MRRLIIPFLIFLPCCAVFPETVMLYIENSEESSFIRDETLPLAIAVEDGIMEVFFDTGHIIFNSGLASDPPPEPPFKSERAAVRLAKAGGASFLLEVALYTSSTDEPFPSLAEYTFTNLFTAEIVTEGEIETLSLLPENSTDPTEVCILLGRDLAKNALLEW